MLSTHKTQMKKFMGYIFQLMKGVDKRVGGIESEPRSNNY